ncbi:preprotein translocase subunit SecF/SecD/SecF fusion protein [Salsuginibacillus halophilus]|uniref:Protein-export membrane protein SecF n=1 Tax=Salsuginibacillus halophilus TaxID=517424 RepID=A0A2P8HFY1_9BACI|nr:protein translocase subunit SecF [Salsuginibacillus halophilus]PSL45113.1 preprotein translocase subunit SecF/SecD/SecF fusion protein [Salsuginibacillus halophilus]
MNFNFERKNIDFVKHRKKFFILPAIVAMIGIILLSTIGLNLGIDFESGSRVEVMNEEGSFTEEEVQNAFEAAGGYEPDDITLAGDDHEQAHARFIGVLDQNEIAEIQTYFDEEYGAEPSVSTVSPQVGQELAMNALISVLIASVGIIIYVSIRFELLYGLAAILALAHDAFFIITVFSITQLEVNVPFIAAVLTIVGYSINDTIVTFDRIRENMQKAEKLETFADLSQVVNHSLLQTLARSINTVLTVVFAAGAIFLLGGQGIQTFAFALLIGLVAGTYSSLFLASQVWLVWKHKQLERQRQKAAAKEAEA